MAFFLALAGIFVGVALLLLARGSLRALGAVVLVAVTVVGLRAMKDGAPPPASTVSVAEGAARGEGSAERSRVGRSGLPPEVEEMWAKIEQGKLRYGAPELESWGKSHSGPVTDTLLSFAALRSGEYDRAVGYAEKALAADPRGGVAPLAERTAGEASYALARYGDAIRHLEAAGKGGRGTAPSTGRSPRRPARRGSRRATSPSRRTTS